MAENRLRKGNYDDPVCENVMNIKTLYRVIRADEDIKNGLHPKDVSQQRTHMSHIIHGSKKGYTSQFISTTKDKSVAERYHCLDKRKTRIVKIDASSLARQGRLYDYSCGKNLRGPMPIGYARRSKDVLVNGSIPASLISTYKPTRDCKAIERDFTDAKAARDKDIKALKLENPLLYQRFINS